MGDPSLDPFYSSLTYGGNPFTEAKLKVKRAERHLGELAYAARELPRRRNYGFVIGRIPDPRKIELIYMSQNAMPMEFGTIVGDAVHNIWAAFDYTTGVISCRPYGKGERSKVSFPTGKNRERFIEARDGIPASRGQRRKPGQMEGAGPDALRIVEELKPYGGGDDSIRALHDVEITDKHRLLIPAASILHVDESEFFLGDKPFSINGTDFKPNQEGTNFSAVYDCGSGADLTQFKRGDKFEASFTIVFGEGCDFFSRREIIPTLSKLCEVAKAFIQTCETVFIS